MWQIENIRFSRCTTVSPFSYHTFEFFERHWRAIGSTEKSFVAYFPMCFNSNSFDNIQKKLPVVRLVHSKRTYAMRALMIALDTFLNLQQRLLWLVYWFLRRTIKKWVHLHLSLYVADVPEMRSSFESYTRLSKRSFLPYVLRWQTLSTSSFYNSVSNFQTHKIIVDWGKRF